MKAPEEIELNTCTFSDIGLFNIDEEEVTYIRKDALWKPTEEQLNALNFAITYFMHETNYKNPTELRDLYDDLLKLK